MVLAEASNAFILHFACLFGRKCLLIDAKGANFADEAKISSSTQVLRGVDILIALLYF